MIWGEQVGEIEGIGEDVGVGVGDATAVGETAASVPVKLRPIMAMAVRRIAAMAVLFLRIVFI